MTWKVFVDDSAKGRFNMILGRYLSTALGLNLKLPKHIIESGDISLKLPTAPIIDLGAYKFKDLNTDKITPEEYFRNTYMHEVYES